MRKTRCVKISVALKSARRGESKDRPTYLVDVFAGCVASFSTASTAVLSLGRRDKQLR